MKGFAWYFKIFNFIFDERQKKCDIDPRRIHAHLVLILSTGLLMWSYALIAWFCFSTPIPGIVGVACATVHLLSPLLFKFTSRNLLITNIMMAAGIIHQGTYSYFSGGFNSFMLIWLAILPMLAGIVSNRKAVLIWSIISTAWAGAYLYLELHGYQFPNLISYQGELLSRILIVFGWIFLSISIIYALLILTESQEKRLASQSKKMEDLFRVLFHDLAGPLSRSSIGLNIAKREDAIERKNHGIEVASVATEAMLEITQNIRKMYAMYKGHAGTVLTYYPLNLAIKYIHQSYEDELRKKGVVLEFDFRRHDGIKVLVEPISFKNQVLGNAISNAIKFSRSGSKIIIRAYPSDTNIIAIEVVDNGIGMPLSILNSLFELDKKTSRPGTSGGPGTGYGMLIMKSFIDLYNGDIKVESREDSEEECGTIIKLLLKGQYPGGRGLPD